MLQSEARLDPVGLVASLLASVCMAGGVVLTKNWGRPVDLLTFTGWQLTAGGLLLTPIALAAEGIPPAMTLSNGLGFLWLGVVGTGIAYSLWFRGIALLPISMTSFLGLLSPLVAATIGWAILGQTLTPLQLVGAVVVGTAVVAPQLSIDEPQDEVSVGDASRLLASRPTFR